MIGALALVAAAAVVWGLSRRLDAELRAEERAALALALGPTLLGWAAFLPALALGPIGAAAGVGALALALWALVLFRRRERRVELRDEVSDLVRRAGAGGWRSAALVAALALCLGATAPVFSEVWLEHADGGLYTGTANNLGDVVLHVAIAHAFAYGENVPPDNVIWAGRRLAYPFLPDFGAASLIALGWPTGRALWVPALAVAAGLCALLGILAWRASGRWLAALLPAPLFLLSGGGQFLLALPGWLAGGVRAWPAATALEAHRIVWKNPLLSLLVTQRATLWGLAAIAAVTLLVWRALEAPRDKEEAATRLLGAAGLVCGALPLVFPHGYLALALVLPLVAIPVLRRLWRGWAWLAAGAALPAVPQVLWILSERTTAFVRWLPGWLSVPEGESPTLAGLVSFWLWNLGPLVPAALAALALSRRIGLRLPGLWAVWWVWFALPSIYAFAPWAWDNTKLFAIWLAMSLVPVSALLAHLLGGGAASRALAGALVVALVASGARDVGHALFAERDYLEYDAERRAAALRLRSATEPRSVVLERPHWAQLAFLAGRRSFIGYPGHLWSHGIDYGERERAVEGFYRSLAPGAAGGEREWRRFLEASGIDYVVVGPDERRQYGSDPERLAAALRRAFRLHGISVFAVGEPAPPG